MEDNLFEIYRKNVVAKISEADKQALPLGWWETVIKHYYRLGYSEDETVRVVLETMKR